MHLLNHLNRAYRFVGQSLLWLVFGLVGAVVGYLMLPLLSLLQADPERRQRRARAIISGCFRWYIAVACVLRIISCRVSGLEHYERDGRQLIMANHPSLIDVVILVSLFPQVECVIKGAVMQNPVLRFPARSANYISNFDPVTCLPACVDRLNSGTGLLLFPEGTRTIPGESLQFKPGAAEIALRGEADMLPVVIDCQPTFLAKQTPWYHVPATRPHFDIRILPPLRAPDLIAEDIGSRSARTALNDALQQLFETELA